MLWVGSGLLLSLGALFWALVTSVVGRTIAVLAVCWFIALLAWLIRAGFAAYPGRIGIRGDGAIRFASDRFLGVWAIIMVLCAMAGLTLLALIVGSPTSLGGSLRALSFREIFLGLALCVLVVYPFHRGVPPVGIELHTDGVRTRKGLSRLFLPWDELLPPEIHMLSKNPVLGLADTSGGAHIVYPIYFGSDPVIVAEVIEYYRTHPEDRHLLADPLAALERVVELDAPTA